jgi:hypothetical protein
MTPVRGVPLSLVTPPLRQSSFTQLVVAVKSAVWPPVSQNSIRAPRRLALCEELPNVEGSGLGYITVNCLVSGRSELYSQTTVSGQSELELD